MSGGVEADYSGTLPGTMQKVVLSVLSMYFQRILNMKFQYLCRSTLVYIQVVTYWIMFCRLRIISKINNFHNIVTISLYTLPINYNIVVYVISFFISGSEISVCRETIRFPLNRVGLTPFHFFSLSSKLQLQNLFYWLCYRSQRTL